MDSPLLSQPSWVIFLIKYTDLLITLAIVYFAFFFTMVAATILFPRLRTMRLPGFRTNRAESPAPSGRLTVPA
jgi:hypothetical protein